MSEVERDVPESGLGYNLQTHTKASEVDPKEVAKTTPSQKVAVIGSIPVSTSALYKVYLSKKAKEDLGKISLSSQSPVEELEKIKVDEVTYTTTDAICLVALKAKSKLGKTHKNWERKPY